MLRCFLFIPATKFDVRSLRLGRNCKAIKYFYITLGVRFYIEPIGGGGRYILLVNIKSHSEKSIYFL